MKKLIWNHSYKDKYFVKSQIFTPFVMLLESIIDIILLPTPYRSDIYSIFLRYTIKQQMKKRTLIYNKNKNNDTYPSSHKFR